MDKGQEKEQAVKLAESEGIGKKGWQRVWFERQPGEEVIRDTVQYRSNASQLCLPAFALNALPASASSASELRETGAGMCRADVELCHPEEKDCVRSISYQFPCQKVQKQATILADCFIHKRYNLGPRAGV